MGSTFLKNALCFWRFTFQNCTCMLSFQVFPHVLLLWNAVDILHCEQASALLSANLKVLYVTMTQAFKMGTAVTILNIGESWLCPPAPSALDSCGLPGRGRWINSRARWAERNIIFWDKRNDYILTMTSDDESYTVSWSSNVYIIALLLANCKPAVNSEIGQWVELKFPLNFLI